ncbi:MAG: PEP-CTERM sorting domain-containing protein [Planctomycetota bacterium]
MELYIDPSPTNTSVVELYADFDRFEPLGPNGRGHLYGNWLSNGNPFNIYLSSDGAYSKVQFIPEPATLFLLGLGALAVLRLRRR